MLPVILVAVGAYLIGDSVLGDGKKYAKGGMTDVKAKKRLEQLRKELRAERISYAELAELESLKEYIDKDDVELRQAAGIPEFEYEDEYAKGGMMAKGGQLEVGDMVMVDDSGYVKVFSGFDTKEPAKIISKDKKKVFGKVKYFYGLQMADGRKPFNNAQESMLTKVSKDGGVMAHGGKTQGYDDKEDERLAMEHGKMSKKDLDSTHARRDDARFEERGKMAKGGETTKEYLFNFTDGGFNSVIAKDKREAIKLAKQQYKNLKVDEKSFRVKTEKDYKQLMSSFYAKGGDVQGKTTSKSQDEQRFAKPTGVRWKDRAVKRGVASNSDLAKSPSKKMQEKYPKLVYTEKRSDKSDVNPSVKYKSI